MITNQVQQNKENGINIAAKNIFDKMLNATLIDNKFVEDKEILFIEKPKKSLTAKYRISTDKVFVAFVNTGINGYKFEGDIPVCQNCSDSNDILYPIFAFDRSILFIKSDLSVIFINMLHGHIDFASSGDKKMLNLRGGHYITGDNLFGIMSLPYDYFPTVVIREYKSILRSHNKNVTKRVDIRLPGNGTIHTFFPLREGEGYDVNNLLYADIYGIKLYAYDYYTLASPTDKRAVAFNKRVKNYLKSKTVVNDIVFNLMRQEIQSDPRIKHAVISNDTLKMDVSIQVTTIIAYSDDDDVEPVDDRRHYLSLDKPLVLEGTVEVSFSRGEAYAKFDNIPSYIQLPNVLDRNKVCLGNTSISGANEIDMLSSVKGVLAILQIPHLDNTIRGHDFFRFLIKSGYISYDKIPDAVKRNYFVNPDDVSETDNDSDNEE